MRQNGRKLGVFFSFFFMAAAMLSGCGKDVAETEIMATEVMESETGESSVAETESIGATVKATDENATEIQIPEATGEFQKNKVPSNLSYAAIIHVKINPEFNLYLDAEEKIVYVEYLNQDAKDLCDNLMLTGMAYDEGMDIIIDAAEEDGYLTAENTVTTEVTWADETISEEEIVSGLESVLEGESHSDSSGGAICTACGGTGICPECGGGTLPCKRCGGTLVETCSNCDASGMQTCPGCKGSGVDATDGSTCRHCGGAGKITCELCGGAHGKPCTICHGKGVISDDCILCHGAKKCTMCGGTGKI